MCGYGGIGRRASFRCWSSQGGAGSSPVTRRREKNSHMCIESVFFRAQYFLFPKWIKSLISVINNIIQTETNLFSFVNLMYYSEYYSSRYTQVDMDWRLVYNL